MKLDPILTKAAHLAKRKNYDAAIKSLEIEASRYYGSFNYHYLLGTCYLYSKIFGMALTYYRLAYEQKMREPNTLLGLAALYLNHGDTDKAVDLYLEVISLDEHNKIAHKALKIIRKHPGPENISNWIAIGKLHTLFPPLPKAGVQRRSIVIGSLSVLALIIAGLGVALVTGYISLPQGREQRVVPENLVLSRDELDAPMQSEGSFRYVLTRTQVEDNYNEGLNFFMENRDDAARTRMNLILESNAPEPVKNRARILNSYLVVPGFNTLEDRFTYAEVIQNPFIFRETHVIWRGMATNLLVEENHTSFDLLVGYDTFRIMEGIVHVIFDFAIPVNTEHPVEILGQVIPISSERESGIRIQGVSLNQTGMLERVRN
ncbi:MAG: tetratricopeptide repeat protein [Treponema sp.]|nr:tetratricopeptide repeat protein [Treponema sp.]